MFPADAPPVLRGHRRGRGAVRVELPAPAAAHPAGRRAAGRRSARTTCSVADYLIRRPLLQALEHPGPRPAVLLIDEIDRADDDFEAFLLELLAEAAVTIPEIGTIRATHPPVIVLTSNRTRDLHDAVKRRCLYHWIDYPDPQRAVDIVRRRVPGASQTLAVQVADAVSRMRDSRRAEAARASPRRSTGWPRWTCSASRRWTRPRSIARSARCSSTRRTRTWSARPASSSSCAAVTDEAGPRRRSGSRRSTSTCRRSRARSAGGCTTPACR